MPIWEAGGLRPDRPGGALSDGPDSMHETATARAMCPRCKALLPPPWPPPGGRATCPGCGGEIRAHLPVTDDTSARLIGKTLGGCRLVALVGRGAMGNVYAARQLSLDRTVAVKTIRPELCSDPEMLARFQAEARTIGLFRTEHVVQVHDVGFEDGIHFIVMEFVGGGHLGHYAEGLPERRLPAVEAVRFLIQAARGLLEAEKLGIVHRDIKPGNLLLDDARRVKIADFGIAKALGDGGQTLFGSGCLVGTPIYMSPEQGRGEAIDHRSDMYSLGATFYHLATGRRPVEGDSVYEVIRWKNRASCLSAPEMAHEGEIARTLSGIIERMTAQRPCDRYPSFADVIAEAEAIAPTSCVELPPRRRRPSARARNLLGAVAFALVAGVGLWILGALVAVPRPGEASREPEAPVEPAGPPTAPPEPPGPAAAHTSGEAQGIERALAALRRRLESEGPSRELLRDARSEFAAASRSPSCGPSVRGDFEAFVRDAEEASRRAALLAAVAAPSALEAPFREAAAYWEKVSAALAPPGDAGPELRAWLEAEARGRAETLRRRLEEPVRSFSGAVLSERERFLRWEVPTPAYAPLAGALEEARAALAGLPKEAGGIWADLLPASLVAGIRSEIEKREALEEALRAAAARIEEIETRVRGVAGFAHAANELGGDLPRTLASARADLEKLGAEAPPSALAEPLERLARAEAEVRSWAEAARLSDEALEAIGARDFTRAAEKAAELRTHRTGESAAGRISSAIADLEAGFRAALAELDPRAARERFSEAASSIAEAAPGSAAERYARSCAERAERLAPIVANMAPVRRGEVLLPGAPEARPAVVEPFFIDRFETSVKEYREFAAALAAMEDSDAARALWRDREVFERYGRRDRIEPRYLSEVEGVDPNWPIEEVAYYQAEAYLRRAGKDLPTVEEWFLAARGPLDGGKHPFDVPSLDVHRDPQRPAPVRRSAAARAFPARHSVHHLAGNVAEWCKAPSEDAARAPLVGGSYLDSDRRCWTGERRDFAPLGTQRRGYGFRGVLRPREFFADLAPIALPSGAVGE